MLSSGPLTHTHTHTHTHTNVPARLLSQSAGAGDAAVGGASGLRPDVLVSLTAPKPCSARFAGAHHFLGGRFVPPGIVERYGLEVPEYEGAAQIVRLGP